MQSYTEWILCPSKSFPGKFYYFNVRNGKAAWGPGDAEITAGRAKKTESHNHPERNIPPAPDALQHAFSISSIQQTPETRPQVTSFSSMHHLTADPIRQKFSSFSSNCQPTPLFGQKTFPRGLPKHEDSDVIWTPNQIQGQIALKNQESTPFGAEYPAFRDHPNISDAGRSQVSQSIKGLKYMNTQGLDDTECKEILVDASVIPMHQRFVNFEAPSISFSRVNKDNIKRLHQKLQSSTPIKKSRSLVDPGLVDKPRVFESKSSLDDFKTNTLGLKPKTGISINKDSVLKFRLFSNTNKQDLNVGLHTQTQDHSNQNCNVWPYLTTAEPVFNGGLLPKSKSLFTNVLPSKSKETSLHFEPPLKSKEPFVNFGPPSKITEPLFNLEPPLKTTEPSFCFEPPPRTKQPIINDGLHSKTTETIFNFDPPLKDPYFNLGPKTKEPSNQYLNVEPSSKIQEPVLNEQPLKPKDPVLNGLPSKPTEGEIEKEQKSVLNGCVKSLKSCIKGDKGDNGVAKSFDDDLRAILISRRRSQDFTNAEFQGSKSKMTKQETPMKKKVTFNLDHECISMVSSMEDDEDMKGAFIELYRPTLAYLKALAPAAGQDAWCILPDTEVLTNDFEFIDDFVQIDPSCKLLIPAVVHSWLLAHARGSARPLATAARNVLRRTTSGHVLVQPCKDQDNPTCTNDDILRSCVENMDQNRHLVLISNDLELLTTAKCYPIPCYSMNSIKNGLPAIKPLKYKKDMKITIKNDTQNIKDDSVNTKSSYDDDLNEKEKAIIRSLRMSEYPIGHNPNLKEKNQNENQNGTFQNGQTETGPNEKNLKTMKYFYRDENMRIADAIELYHSDSHNITPSVDNSGPNNETHDISNISTIQNESMGIETCFQLMEINEPMESINNEKFNKDKIEAGWRSERETTNTTKEDDIQILNIKDRDKIKSLHTDEAVAVFNKNQKSVDLQNFNKMKISLKNNIAEVLEENNKQKDIEKENQEPHIKNRDPRLEIRKSNDSILDFCKEKTKEPSTTEFENGQTNMTSQCKKIDKTNKSSLFDTRSKSNMASTSNGFEVSKPHAMMNRIDLKRFYVKNKDMEHRLKARIDEWICFYTQIMEESLSSVLQKLSASELSSLPPWSLSEALHCIDTVYGENSNINKIVCHLCSCFYESRYKMRKCIRPEEFMRALGCSAKLLEYLEIILPSIIEVREGVTALQALLIQIEDDTDPSIGLSESLLTTPLTSQTDELDVRHNFVKDTSEVTDYLKKHFAAWKDYDSSHNIKVFRIRGKKGTKLEKRSNGIHVTKDKTSDRNGYVSKLDDAITTTKTNNVGKYSRDKKYVDTDKNIGGRKASYDTNKTGAMDDRNKHVENNIEYNSNKVKDGKLQVEEGPTIIRNVSILKEFETKLRKRKTKLVNVDKNPLKKSKIDVNTASNYKIYKDTDKKVGHVNNVYQPDKDPKLFRDIPKVVINMNLISDYEEKMRLKRAKKLYNSDKTEDNDNHSTKTDNKHDKYSLNSYKSHNNNHTITNVTKNNKESYNSDYIDNQVQKIINHNAENDNNNKDVTTDSGLGNELPRWSSVVDTYTAEIEKSLNFIMSNMDSALGTFREDSATETLRMRAFEMDYLICRILGMLRSLLHLCADEDDRARNNDAVGKYMAQAKSIHDVVNSLLSVTNLPVSSGMSFNSLLSVTNLPISSGMSFNSLLSVTNLPVSSGMSFNSLLSVTNLPVSSGMSFNSLLSDTNLPVSSGMPFNS